MKLNETEMYTWRRVVWNKLIDVLKEKYWLHIHGAKATPIKQQAETLLDPEEVGSSET
jgi:hypothetical protein